MATDVPLDEFSAIVSEAPLVSVTALVLNSSRSLIAMVKTVSAVEPSAEVARTVMLRMAPSVSRFSNAAVVTTPVPASIAKLPPSLSDRE